MGPEEAYRIVNTGGVIGLLILIIFFGGVGLYKRWWVPGWILDDAETERDEWKKVAEDNGKKLTIIIEMLERRLSTRATR